MPPLQVSVNRRGSSRTRSSPDSSPTSGIGSVHSGGTSSDDSSDTVVQSVLCMYDFQSNDPVHLPFHKNEILDVVQMEDTGWWAAMRAGGDVIGWIPRAFVNPLSDEMTDRLKNVRQELRVYEYEAERLYNSAPISRSVPLDDSEPFSPPPSTDSVPDSRRYAYPPSPATPMPQPPTTSAPIDKPTPPTPTDPAITVAPLRYRSDSAPSVFKNNRMPGPSRLSSLDIVRDPPNGSSTRRDKITRLTGSEDARVFHEAVQAQVQLPWYLRPKHADQLQFDLDGQVRTGTTDALVEKLTSDTLTSDPIKMAQDTMFRKIFLLTFRTFISADELFDKLVDIFRTEYPSDLTDTEFDDWKEKYLLPSQRVILNIFTLWLENYALLEEEPHIAQRLTDFLALVTSPSQLAMTAGRIVQTIERLTFASPSSSRQLPVAPRKRRKSRPHKGDLLRLDPADIAEQLALMEFNLYVRITPQECIKYTKCQTGPPVINLSNFCATHDKLVAWVQTTILFNETLGKRADTVDFWIKVAEKCRNLNNLASMSAIVNALSSVVLTRLHLTWAHVGKKANLDALSKFNDPSGGFANYRTLHLTSDGPCVPFIGMYLTDIVHIQDQFTAEGDRVSFVQCQRWYEAVTNMLRSQTKPYLFGENEPTYTFISGHLQSMGTSSRDQARLWARSQEVQRSEFSHADIRKGLEAAGF